MQNLSEVQSKNLIEQFPIEYCETFYKNLLHLALTEIGQLSSPVMVCGPLHHNNQFQKNYQVFLAYQDYLSRQNYTVFNQLQYLDREIAGAPFDFDIKFEVFYKGIIASKLISKFFFHTRMGIIPWS